MSTFDADDSRKRARVATSDADVGGDDPPHATPDEGESASSDPGAELEGAFAPGAGNAERDRFIAELEKEWGRFIDKNLRHPDILAESAKDLHQKALITLAAQRQKLIGPPAQVVKFVDTVVLNLLRNHRRRATLEVAQGADVDAQATSAPGPEDAVRRAELWKKFQVYFGRLSPEEAEVVEAKELHGMTFEIIATAVGRSRTKVFNQHARAMKKLEDMALASERAADLGAQRRNGPGK